MVQELTARAQPAPSQTSSRSRSDAMLRSGLVPLGVLALSNQVVLEWQTEVGGDAPRRLRRYRQ